MNHQREFFLVDIKKASRGGFMAGGRLRLSVFFFF